MKKKLLSLALALALCLGLAAPASAAGAKEVYVDETHGVRITFDGFLRKERGHYMLDDEDTVINPIIYIVEENSTVTIEALKGRKYARVDEEGYIPHEEWEAFYEDPSPYAYQEEFGFYWSYGSFYRNVQDSGRSLTHPLTGPKTETVSSSGSIDFGSYEITWLCESDFAKLVPLGNPNASGWAQEDMVKAFDADLFPSQLNPYSTSCARGMTRAEFASVTVHLYAAMLGKGAWELGVSYEHPFSDLAGTALHNWDVGTAYNLGFVQGRGGSLFDPEGTLTRQEAAVMLGRVYSKLYGQIPVVSNTAFADDKDVKSWAKSEVAFMAEKGIVKGVGDNKFAPTKTLSIQEAMTMANRMLEKLK